MSKNSVIACPLVWLVVACGSGEGGSQDSGSARSQPAGASRTACAVLEEAVPELFGVDKAAVTFRPSDGGGHDTCSASWPIPEGETAKRYGNEVSLTIMSTTYDSPEAAVASLESTVTTLTEGVSVDVGGEERTVKSGFGDWVEGLGDRAILKKRAVLVASGGRRFTVAANVSDDDAENQQRAIELARRVVEGS